MQQDYAGLSYEQVVHRYASAVASACLMRLNNWADAEDCFQNTFVKLYTSAPVFKDEAHLKAWLLRVAINESRSVLRSHGRTLPLDAVGQATVFMDEDSVDSFPTVLMKLKPKYREALYLYYCEGYSVEEVAGILKRNLNTVKTLLHRGREKLKEVYGGESIE